MTLPSAHYGPIRHPARPGLLVAERPLRVTRPHRAGFPCCLLIPLAHMPSPLPRRDRSSVVARNSTSGGLPRRSGRSAPAWRVSRSARRSLALWPACSLTPGRSRFPECFSPSRCLLEPLQALPVGATSYRAGFAPAGIDTPFHGTLADARNQPCEPSAKCESNSRRASVASGRAVGRHVCPNRSNRHASADPLPPTREPREEG